MNDRITSMPAQTSVTFVQLPGQEIELAHGEMYQTRGGLFFPSDTVTIIIATNYVVDCVSEWIDDVIDDVNEIREYIDAVNGGGRND